MKVILTIICFRVFLASCQNVKLFPFEKLFKDSLPKEGVREVYNGDGIWYNTLSRNDTLFVYNSLDKDVDFFGDTLNFDLDSIDFRREDHIILWGNRHFKKIKNGWLVGTNKGEWGGSLFWVSEDHKEYKKLGYANVNKIFEWNNKIYILEGVSHLNVSEGHVIEISEKLELDTLITFPESPYSAVLSPDNTLYVLTDYKLFKVQGNGINTCLYTFAHWPSFGSDISYLNEQLYIGMHHGVAKYNLITNEIEWFRTKIEQLITATKKNRANSHFREKALPFLFTNRYHTLGSNIEKLEKHRMDF